MPYDLDDFEAEVRELETPELHELKDKYTRHLGSSTMGSAGSLVLGPFMPIGLAISMFMGGNAAGKLTIIRRELQKRNESPLLSFTQGALGCVRTGAFQSVGHSVPHFSGSEALALGTEQGLEHGYERVSESSRQHIPARRRYSTAPTECAHCYRTVVGKDYDAPGKCPGCKGYKNWCTLCRDSRIRCREHGYVVSWG